MEKTNVTVNLLSEEGTLYGRYERVRKLEKEILGCCLAGEYSICDIKQALDRAANSIESAPFGLLKRR